MLSKYFGNKIFSSEKANDKRQLELDVAKTFAIVLMIMVHCLAFCSLCQINHPYLKYLFIFMQCSAPLFMFAMGVGMVYTRHNSPKEFINRGIKLILMGFIINIIYFVSGYFAELELEYCILSLIANDILQFAGLSFILIGLFKSINLNIKQILLVALILSLIGTFINLEFSNMYLKQILGHFIGTEGYKIVSCFPVLNWFMVPVVGILFGNYLIRCTDKNQFYKKIFLPTSLLSLIFMAVGLVTRSGMFSSTGGKVYEKLQYLHISTPDVLIMLIFVLFLISFFYFLLPFFPRKVEQLIKIVSRNVTNIYIIQWALLLLLINPLNDVLKIKPNLIFCVLVIIGLTSLSILLSEIYVKMKIKIDNIFL